MTSSLIDLYNSTILSAKEIKVLTSNKKQNTNIREFFYHQSAEKK